MAQAPAARGPLRVLIVDDDPVVRQILALAMAQQGFDVAQTSDGLEALDRVPEFAPDVVVTDLDMPRCGGDELCRRLKADATTRHIPIVVVTGSLFDEHQLLAVGCAQVMTKPIRGRDLADAVVRLGEHRSAPFGVGVGTANLAPDDTPSVTWERHAR